ncbi:MAG: hypothetical protein NVSMB57_12560 [Actinomycetota bacterium]
MKRFPSGPARIVALTVSLILLVACGRSGKRGTHEDLRTTSEAALAFSALGSKGSAASHKIVYRMSGATNGNGTLVFAQSPPQRSFRMHSVDRDATVLAEGTDFVACGTDACYRINGLGDEAGAAGSAFFGTIAQAFDAFNALSALPGFSLQGSRTIAGRHAQCASWKASFSPGGVQECLDDQTGVVLWLKIQQGDGPRELEAVSFSNPSAPDFKPAFPVEDLPTSFGSLDPTPS